MLGMIWGMLYFLHLYYISYIFFLFHFIFELLSIFMLMINIVKIELINPTENCLLSIFTVRKFFYQLNYSLRIPLMWSKLRSIDIICRSSHPEVLLGKGVLKICSKFTGEHSWRSAILIKLLCNSGWLLLNMDKRVCFWIWI